MIETKANTIRVSKKLHAQILKDAKTHRWSYSKMVEHVLEQYYAKNK